MVKFIEIPDSCYFSDYFKSSYYIEDILNYFGYGFEVRSIELPKSAPQDVEALKSRLTASLPFVTLDSESARREFLIAPLLIELIHLIQVKIKISYSLKATEQLKGNLDYYLESGHQLLIIEAKDENLERGFKQLAAELIALDYLLGPEEGEGNLNSTGANNLYGAVSIGRIWQFAVLDRQQKKMVQDLDLYRVPSDMGVLIQILVGILNNEC